jgi:hypothetical protein
MRKNDTVKFNNREQQVLLSSLRLAAVTIDSGTLNEHELAILGNINVRRSIPSLSLDSIKAMLVICQRSGNTLEERHVNAAFGSVTGGLGKPQEPQEDFAAKLADVRKAVLLLEAAINLLTTPGNVSSLQEQPEQVVETTPQTLTEAKSDLRRAQIMCLAITRKRVSVNTVAHHFRSYGKDKTRARSKAKADMDYLVTEGKGEWVTNKKRRGGMHATFFRPFSKRRKKVEAKPVISGTTVVQKELDNSLRLVVAADAVIAAADDVNIDSRCKQLLLQLEEYKQTRASISFDPATMDVMMRQRSFVMSSHLNIVEKACKFSEDMSQGTVVVTCDLDDNAAAFDLLKSVASRNMAIGHAARQGMADPRINGNTVGPYPVNSEGESLDDVAARNLPPGDPATQPATYRIDVPVSKKIL